MTAASRWAAHLLQDILPWWEAHGVDDRRGGIRTGFDNRGQLATSDRFTWSQGRWAWLAGELADEADAGRLDLDPYLWRSRCLATCDRLVAEAVRSDGRTHFRVTEAGVAVPDQIGETATSVFADLFCVLGLAAGLRHLSSSDPRRALWSAIASTILTTARSSIEEGTATSDPYPVPDGFIDLAGPMTLLHVSSELLRSHEAADDALAVGGWAGHRLATRHFANGQWREFAPMRPGRESTLLARHVTPGHLLELLWMIEHAGVVNPSFDVLDRPARIRLATRAMSIGWDDQLGGILRYADGESGPPRGDLLGDSPYEVLVQDTWDTKLWWVHAEALYTLSLYADESKEIAEWAELVGTWTMQIFPEPGAEWIQIRDRRGDPLDRVVALPVKDPFHIARTLIFLNRLPARRSGHGEVVS